MRRQQSEKTAERKKMNSSTIATGNLIQIPSPLPNKLPQKLRDDITTSILRTPDSIPIMQEQLHSSLRASGWMARLEAFIANALRREESVHTKSSSEDVRKQVLTEVMEALKTPTKVGGGAGEQGLRVAEEDLHVTINVLQEILVGICQVVDESEYEVE